MLTALLLLGILPVATAQETTDTVAAREQKPGLVKQVLERFSKSYGYFDERYVRKPPTKLIVTLKGKVQQAGVSINDFSEFENDWGLSNSTQTDIQLQEHVCRKVGIYLTYSGIRAGGGMKVGRKSAERDISLYLGKLSPYYGLIGRYFNIKDKVTSDIHGMKDYHGEGWEIESENINDTHVETDYPADLREIQLDGYYAFNRSRFAYTAVYGGNVVQRRSAGSWMLGMKYLYGRVKFDSRETDFPNYVGGITRFATHQLSVGGGYSYNLVALNRDERGPRLQGLRNLTFNATVMPMVTVLNPLTIYYNENHVEWFGYERNQRTRHSHPQLNYTATVGMALSIDRLGFDVRFHYDNFHFNTGLQTDNLNNLGKEYSVQQNRMKGRFYNWGVEAEMHIKL